MQRKPKQVKKGLGAQKMSTNVDFSKIEQEALKVDEIQNDDSGKQEKFDDVNLSKEEKIEKMENMKQVYEDISARREEKLKNLDPKKAEQLERLGMGFSSVLDSKSSSSNFSSKSSSKSKSSSRSGVSHSAINDMIVIEQVEAEKPSRRSQTADFDDFGTISSTSRPLTSASRDLERDMMLLDLGLSNSSSGHHNLRDDEDDFFSSFGGSSSRSKKQTSFEIEEIESHSKSSAPKSKTVESYSLDGRNEKVAQDKFGSAKAISSEQFFGPKESEYETRSTLSKFEGSSSISSDQYFGRENSNSKPQTNAAYYTSAVRDANLDDIKEGVREGVTKVAGKLSSLANDVMTSFNEKYGGY